MKCGSLVVRLMKKRLEAKEENFSTLVRVQNSLLFHPYEERDLG